MFLALFFCGFSLGVLFLNFWWKSRGRQIEAAAIAALASFSAQEVPDRDFFLRLLQLRGIPLLLGLLSAVTIFGVIVSVLAVLILGFLAGGLLTLGLLELGIKGGVLALGFLLPQYFFYMAAIILLGEIVFSISLRGWTTMKIPLGEYGRYGGPILLLLGIYLAGIFLEAYASPEIVDFLISVLHIVE